MSTPSSALPRVQRNKRTGEMRVSYDGGTSWQPVALPPAPGAGAAPAPTPAPAAATPPPRETPATVPRETAPVTPPAAITPPAAAPTRPAGGFKGGLGDWLIRRTAGAGSTVGDALQGLGQGVTFGFGDELAAGIGEAIAPDDPTDIPREYGAGSRYADARDSGRRDLAEASERSPIAYGGGEVLGSTATTVLGGAGLKALGAGAKATQAAGLGTKMARGAATGGALGAASGVGHSEAEGSGVVEDAAAGGALGGALGGTLPAVAEGVKRVVVPLGTWLRGRAVGTGALDPEGERVLAQQLGVPRGRVTSEVGRRAESLELPSASPLPMGRGGYADAAEAKAGELGKPFGEILDRNSALGVQVPKAEVEADLRRRSLHYAQTPGADAASMKRAADAALTRDMAGVYAGKKNLTARDLHTLKTQADRAGGRRTGEAPSQPSQLASKEANRDLAGLYRDRLHSTMDELALREDVPEFHRLNSQIGDARMLQGIARGAEGRSDMTGAAARGFWDPYTAALRGAETFGADAGAMTMRGTARTADAAQRVAPGLAASLGALAPQLTPDAPLPPPPLPPGPTGPSRMPPVQPPASNVARAQMAQAPSDDLRDEHTDSALYLDALQDNPELRQRLRRQAEAEQ